MNPPRAAARVPEQDTQTAYYSESPDEGSDEELRAMQNIRNRARQRQGRVCIPLTSLVTGELHQQYDPRKDL